eukprot:m.257221 g.257221  ORF g.257221 m.257221 type:complete len:435 (-) comp35066_c0_seq1:29-1333(-)
MTVATPVGRWNLPHDQLQLQQPWDAFPTSISPTNFSSKPVVRQHQHQPVMAPSNSNASGVSTPLHHERAPHVRLQPRQQHETARLHHTTPVQEQHSNEPCVPIAWRFYKRNNSNTRKQNKYITHKDAQLGLSLVVFFIKSLPPHIFQYCFPGLTLDQSCVKGTVLIQDGRFLDELLFRVVGVDGEMAHVDNATHIDQLDRFDIEPVLQFFYSFGLVKLPSHSDTYVRSLSEKLDQIALTSYGSTTSAFYTKRNDGATATAKNANHPQVTAATTETASMRRAAVEPKVEWHPPPQASYNNQQPHQLASQPIQRDPTQAMSKLSDRASAPISPTPTPTPPTTSTSTSTGAQPSKPKTQHNDQHLFVDRANIDADTDSSSSCEYEHEPYQRLYLTKPEATTLRKKTLTARKKSSLVSSNSGMRMPRVRSVLKDFPTF